MKAEQMPCHRYLLMSGQGLGGLFRTAIPPVRERHSTQ